VRVLWAKANKIWPLHSGGDIRSYNLVRQLARRNEVTFLSYYDGAADAEYEKTLQENLPGAVCISTGRNFDSTWRRGLDYLSRLPGKHPYAVSRFTSSQVSSRLLTWYSGQAFDIAVCDFLDAAVNFPDQLSIPTVLFQHNVESEIWRRHATNGASSVKKVVYRLEFAKMRRYEEQMVRRFHHVIAVSEHDKRLISAWTEESRISVVATGVDTEQFCAGLNPPPQKGLVLFAGAMDWEPNIDAVEYFCREIWPEILARAPGAHFRIVGRNPGTRVQSLACDSVEVTGRVPSVVDHLREASVVVVPLRIGGGTRLKIYEAMAVGKAVVSTSIGAEGLDVHDDQDIVLSDSPQKFSEAVVMLLTNRDRRIRLEQAAADLAKKFSWPLLGSKFEEILRSVVGGSPRGPRLGVDKPGKFEESAQASEPMRASERTIDTTIGMKE
jgi:glycosyltransferase involved in cell wall biosynthesis